MFYRHAFNPQSRSRMVVRLVSFFTQSICSPMTTETPTCFVASRDYFATPSGGTKTAPPVPLTMQPRPIHSKSVGSLPPADHARTVDAFSKFKLAIGQKAKSKSQKAWLVLFWPMSNRYAVFKGKEMPSALLNFMLAKDARR